MRTLAFLLCVVLFITTFVAVGFIFRSSELRNYSGNVDDLLLYNDYQGSVEFQREFDFKINTITYMLDEFKSEDYIKSGESIRQETLDNSIQSYFYENNEKFYHEYGNNYDEPGVKEKFVSDHASEIAAIKESMIMDQLYQFEKNGEQLENLDGFTYYATDGTYMITNLKEMELGKYVKADDFKTKSAYFVYERGNFSKVPGQLDNVNGWMRNYDHSLKDTLDRKYNPNLKLYFAFDDNFLSKKEAKFDEAKAELMKWLPMAIICGLLSLALLIYLLIVTGKKDEEGNRPVYKIDTIFTEIQLMIIAFFLIIGGAGFGRFLFEAVNYGIGYNGNIYVNSDPLILSLALAAIIGLGSAGFGLMFILSCVRNLKAGRFIGNSIIYIVLRALFRGIKSIYHGGSLMRKVVLITLAVCLLSATIALAPVVAMVIIVLAPKWVHKFEEIKTGVNEVKNGNLTYKIPLYGDGELDELARGINEISEASNIAIQNELKNQRMKTDLISNVSHDLKTPLTSIISYVDLLKKEGLDCEDAPKYLDILDQKSQRLQKLTEDLFDAAKASSGAITVKFEKVEMLSLINQGLGEMSDKIQDSGLEFKISAKNEKYYVNADGQLMWRVVENLLGNILKYAQEGSRVYIDLTERGGINGKTSLVVLEMKNISKSELNIDAEELMERFKRGDESRTTEGSGLGLAIAKDLVRLQNGWFEIKIDGDLFKAIVMLEALPQSQENADA